MSGSQIAQLASSKLGCPYKYGGNGPNEFDCSGFTKWVHQQFGISIPRTAEAQSNSGSASNGAVGDIVCFGSPCYHVGICVGNGYCIHASTPGDVVKKTLMQYIDKTIRFRRYSKGSGGSAPRPAPAPAPQNSLSGKSTEQLAREVLAGKYGNGDARKNALGSRYYEVQARVNEICRGGSSGGSAPQNSISGKSTEQLAREVLAGKYGNGDARKNALGSRYYEVQARVNEICRGH
jgi:hypothetical protein